MDLRDHKPLVIEEFNGLYKRGDEEACPQDHFPDCENLQFFESGFETRDGIDTFIAKGNILRLYIYVMQSGESILLLTTGGEIFHALLDGSNTVYGPILSIADMTDFGLESVAGRAYITPFKTFIKDTDEEYQKGIEGEFLYVYKGDGTSARKAAGNPPTDSDTSPLVAYENKTDGKIDKGIHIFAVTFGDGVGGESTGIGPTVLPLIYASGNKEAVIENIQIGPVGITERKIWATQAIDPKDFNPNVLSYTYYLVATISDNTTTFKTVSFADTELTTPFVAGILPNPTSGGITAENHTVDGYCDPGLHIIGVVYETDTGYYTAPGPEIMAVQTFVNAYKSIIVKGIPVSPDPFVTKRHLVASREITLYNGDDRGFQLFFIPEGTIENNVDTEKVVNFFDNELLEDASYLIDNFAEIPAGVRLTSYNGRLVLTTSFDDISVARLSAPGEPEAIDQVDGLVIFPLDGDPITTAQEFRDVLYLFKKTKTYAAIDNGGEPSSWQVLPIDQGIGCSIHGIATVLDSGGVNIEYLMIVDWSGLMLFNGLYARPELSWKIADFWLALDRNAFANIQIMNNSIGQRLYITLPDKKMLYASYDDGLNYKKIKWCPWRFDIETTTIALVDTDVLLIGSEQLI